MNTVSVTINQHGNGYEADIASTNPARVITIGGMLPVSGIDELVNRYIKPVPAAKPLYHWLGAEADAI